MSAWFDAPGPPPATRRRPFEDLLVELAERTGRPLWRVRRVGQPTRARCDCGGRPLVTADGRYGWHRRPGVRWDAPPCSHSGEHVPIGRDE